MSRSLLLAALFLVAVPCTASAQVLEFELDGTGAQSMLGASLAFVGDLNNDGIDEFVAGAPLDGPIGPRRGAAYVYDGATRTVLLQWLGSDDWELGHAVAGPGDVDKDGVPDVMVSAHRINDYAGRVYLYSGADGSVIREHSGSQSYEHLGYSITELGDVDGDGWLDYAASAVGFGLAPTTSTLTVYSGRDGGVHWQSSGGGEGLFGFCLDSLGDVDGDGLGDLIVGARGYSSTGAGEVFVLSGANGAVIHHYLGQPNARLGRTVANAGDVDQDGKDDFLLSVAGNNTVGNYPKVRLYSSGTGLLLHEWVGDGYFGNFGQALSAAGDQTGDGVPDLLIGQSMASVNPVKLWLVDGASKAYAHGFQLPETIVLGLDAGGELNGFGAGEILVGIPTEGIQARPGEIRGYSIGCGPEPIELYCSTSPNSVGPGATMAWQGSSSVADNDLRLEAWGCPPGQFGIFYYGASEAVVPFGDGLRCVAGAVTRLAAVSTGSGAASLLLDIPTLPASRQIAAGARRYFQFWYRDPAFGGTGFNLSDALKVEFCL